MAKLYEGFEAKEYTEVLNQIVVPREFLGNTHFKLREDLSTSNFRIPIYRGDSVIMEAIASGAERPTYGDAAEHLLPASLARFAERKPITPSDLRRYRDLSGGEGEEETFTSLIGRRLGEIKNRFAATKEYMRIGAIMGEVFDGAGKSLFSFKSNLPVTEFKGANPDSAFETISDAISNDFGYAPGFVGYVSRGFYNKAWAYAIAQALVKNQIVRKEVLSENGSEVTVINYNGVILRPLIAQYKNAKGALKPFIPENQAVFVPKDDGAFREYYTNAEHTKAMEMSATEYFADAEELPEG